MTLLENPLIDVIRCGISAYAALSVIALLCALVSELPAHPKYQFLSQQGCLIPATPAI